MNLHRDPEAFAELVTAASSELHIPVGIIEKDYYVTLALRELNSRIKGMVFKGGTSLTKCYQVLNRFSEDIDISYAASEGVPGESRKRQLKKAVVSAMEALQFPIINLDDTRSRRSYNCYRATYPTRYAPIAELKPELMIETYIALLPFPTVTRMADNYIHRFLKETDQEHLAEEFDLMPFSITTQAIERTLIDKVFAICDYYMQDRVKKHSRHIYDIYKLLPVIPQNEEFKNLIKNVRSVRAMTNICLSAQLEVNVPELLNFLIENKVYRDDYEKVIARILEEDVNYETTIKAVKEIAASGLFE